MLISEVDLESSGVHVVAGLGAVSSVLLGIGAGQRMLRLTLHTVRPHRYRTYPQFWCGRPPSIRLCPHSCPQLGIVTSMSFAPLCTSSRGLLLRRARPRPAGPPHPKKQGAPIPVSTCAPRHRQDRPALLGSGTIVPRSSAAAHRPALLGNGSAA